MDFVIHSSEIDIWADVACMAVFSCTSVIRLSILIYKKDDLYNLMSKWEGQLVRKSPINPARKDVESWVFKTKAYVLIITSLTMLIAFHWCVYPITVTALFPEQGRKLPLRAWYPFDMYASPYYEFVYLMQVIRGTFGSFIAIIWETTLMTFCILTYHQVKRLKEHLRIIATDFNEDDGARIEDYLTKCILHHGAVIRFAKRIGEMYSHVLLVEFFGLVAPMCFTALKATSISDNDTKYLVWMEYFMACLIQLFLLCLGGHIVTTQLLSIQAAAYEAYSKVHCKTSWKLAFIMLHSNLELKITGGNFFVLSMKTFKTIMGMSLSNFIVLRQLKESKYLSGLQSESVFKSGV